MIKADELRWGNRILYKYNGRILPVACVAEHFFLLARGEDKDLFPIVLKAELLLQYGFIENKDYALYPQAREFKLVLPVKGKEHHELLAYVKSSGECIAWYSVNKAPASNQVQQLHQLQNLHYAITGTEL